MTISTKCGVLALLFTNIFAFAQQSVTTPGGNTNSVPKFSSAGTVVNSAITEVNGLVGVGNSSPNGGFDIALPSDTSGSPGWTFGPQEFVVGAGTVGAAGSGGVFTSWDQSNTRGFIGAVSPGVAWRNLILQPYAGNVGIQTLNPLTQLQVGSLTTLQTVIGSQMALNFNSYYDGSAWRYIADGGATSLRSYNNGLAFHINPPGSAGTSISTMDSTAVKMFLFPDGGLALGNGVMYSDPGANNLTVQGSIATGSGIHFPDGSFQSVAFSPSSGSLNITSPGTGILAVSSTTPPNSGGGSLLEINGNAQSWTWVNWNSGNGGNLAGSLGLVDISNNGLRQLYDPYGNLFFGIKNNDGSGTVGSSSLAVMSNGNVGIGTVSPGALLDVSGNILISAKAGTLNFADGSSQGTAWNGILPGGDYAESVDVDGDRQSYEPGDLIAIDPQVPGNFNKPASSYSRLVAGVFSTKPGVVGRRATTARLNKAREVPMAITGIVPTKVTAENGSIEPGDLLVSSSTPGYCMKGTDTARLAGAVVGKALAPLKGGSGVIEVLISLQ